MVNVAAQRARQLMQGASPLARTNSRKPAAIAIREVEEGLVPYYIPEDEPEEAAILEASEEEEEEEEEEPTETTE
jgi:DNA-directed RNA polymerase subunit K/omega